VQSSAKQGFQDVPCPHPNEIDFKVLDSFVQHEWFPSIGGSMEHETDSTTILVSLALVTFHCGHNSQVVQHFVQLHGLIKHITQFIASRCAVCVTRGCVASKTCGRVCMAVRVALLHFVQTPPNLSDISTSHQCTVKSCHSPAHAARYGSSCALKGCPRAQGVPNSAHEA
jgi:hypothetical protein